MFDFGLAPGTFFGYAFGAKILIFSKLMQLFFEIHGFLLRGWLSCLAGLAELAGRAEGRKVKEGREEGGGGKGGGRRTTEEEGERGRKEEKEERKEEVATFSMSVFGCASVCSVRFVGETIFRHVCEVENQNNFPPRTVRDEETVQNLRKKRDRFWLCQRLKK